jgi:hypothetical protein
MCEIVDRSDLVCSDLPRFAGSESEAFAALSIGACRPAALDMGDNRNIHPYTGESRNLSHPYLE